MDKVLQFLQELSKNNNREWFNENRKRYEESRDKIIFISDILINEIGKFDSEINGVSPKDCVFRIFRDVRFSKDKRPYKTNFGSFISKGGRKSMNPGYYFHLEPGQCFIGGGVYMPPAEPLKAIRSFMAEHAREFLDIIEDKSFKSSFPEMYDHQLKTAPKGYPKDHKYIDLLRYKSFVFSESIADEDVTSDGFIEHMVDSFKKLHKVNAFLIEAIQNKE